MDVEHHGQHEGGGADAHQGKDPGGGQLQQEQQHGEVEHHGAHLAVPPGLLHPARGLHHRQAQEPLQHLLQAQEAEDPVDEGIAEGQADEQGRLGQAQFL